MQLFVEVKAFYVSGLFGRKNICSFYCRSFFLCICDWYDFKVLCFCQSGCNDDAIVFANPYLNYVALLPLARPDWIGLDVFNETVLEVLAWPSIAS